MYIICMYVVCVCVYASTHALKKRLEEKAAMKRHCKGSIKAL